MESVCVTKTRQASRPQPCMETAATPQPVFSDGENIRNSRQKSKKVARSAEGGKTFFMGVFLEETATSLLAKPTRIQSVVAKRS